MKTTQEARQELREALINFRDVLFKPFNEPLLKMIDILSGFVKKFIKNKAK